MTDAYAAHRDAKDAQLESGPTKLYGQLSSILRSQIASGRWAPGSAIPTLDELSRSYSVARTTAHKAIQTLVEEGLLSSQRGRRTCVTPLEQRKKGERIFSWIGFGQLRNDDYAVRVLSQQTVGELPAGWFIGTPGAAYMWIRKIDLVGQRPFCFTDMYILKEVFDRFPAGAERHAEMSRLARDFASPALVVAKERSIVAAADYAEAQYLDYPRSSPVARATRVFCDSDLRIVLFAKSVYRGDLYGVENDLLAYLVQPT